MVRTVGNPLAISVERIALEFPIPLPGIRLQLEYQWDDSQVR